MKKLPDEAAYLNLNITDDAVDQFFIERSGLLLKRKRFENFVNMSIEYK